MNALKTDLENALLDCMMGDPWGPALASRMQTAVHTVLHRYRIAGAGLRIFNGPRGVEVEVTLPPGPRRVERVVLRMNPGAVY